MLGPPLHVRPAYHISIVWIDNFVWHLEDHVLAFLQFFAEPIHDPFGRCPNHPSLAGRLAARRGEVSEVASLSTKTGTERLKPNALVLEIRIAIAQSFEATKREALYPYVST